MTTNTAIHLNHPAEGTVFDVRRLAVYPDTIKINIKDPQGNMTDIFLDESQLRDLEAAIGYFRDIDCPQ